MAKFYEYPSKKITLGILNGNGELISSLEVNDNPTDIRDAIAELKTEIHETNFGRSQENKDLLQLHVMPDVEYLVEAEENLPSHPISNTQARFEAQAVGSRYPQAIANPLALGFKDLRMEVQESQEKPKKMHEPIQAFYSLKIKNLDKPITIEDLQSISLGEAYIRLGKYIGTQKERFAYNRVLDLGNNDAASSDLVAKKLKSFFEHLFIHTNFKLQKASIPANLEVLDLVRMAEIPDDDLKKTKNKKPRKEKDGTGELRNIVDLTWGTSGLALSPFHSLFVRTDPMQMSQTQPSFENSSKEKTSIPAFYDAVIEEIQFLYNQILYGVPHPETGKKYKSILDSLDLTFEVHYHLKNILVESFNTMRDATQYDRKKCIRNTQGQSVWVSNVDGEWSNNPIVKQNIIDLQNTLGLNGLSPKGLESNAKRILLDATLDLLFLYFIKAEIQKCITDDFPEFSSEKDYQKKLDTIFFKYVSNGATKEKNNYYQWEKRAELPPLDLGLQFGHKDVGCEAITISNKATLHVPNMCSKSSMFCQNSCLVVAGQNVVAGSSILGNEYEVGTKTKQEMMADNSDEETSSGEENTVDYEEVSKGKYRTQKTKEGTTVLKQSQYAESKKVMYIRRDLFPYQTRNYARKMYVNLMFLREPLAFCKVLVEVLMKYAVGMDKSKEKLIAKGFLKDSAKTELPAYYRLNVYSDVPWEVMFPGLFDAFSGKITLDAIRHSDDKTDRIFRFGSKDSTKIGQYDIIPRIQFYDYTKISNRGPYHYDFDAQTSKFSLINERTGQRYPTENPMKVDVRPNLKKIDNYHLTFSYSGNNVEDSINELEFNNRNVTFAFFRVTSKRYENFKEKYVKHLKSLKQSSPQTIHLIKDVTAFFNNVQTVAHFPKEFWGYKVIDGDLYDNRTFDRLFRESNNEAQVVGLKWKFVRVSKGYKLSDPLTTPAAAAFSHLMLGEYKYQQENDSQTEPNQLFLVNLSKDLWTHAAKKDPTAFENLQSIWIKNANDKYNLLIEQESDYTKKEELKKAKIGFIQEEYSRWYSAHVRPAKLAGRPQSFVDTINNDGTSDKDFFADMFSITKGSSLYDSMDADLPLMRIYYHFKDLQGSSTNKKQIDAYLEYLIPNFVGPVLETGKVINQVTKNT